jgi:putative transposase
VLRHIVVEMALEKNITVICKEADVFEESTYRWRNEYGNLKGIHTKKMKDLKQANARPRRLETNLSLNKQALEGDASRSL